MVVVWAGRRATLSGRRRIVQHSAGCATTSVQLGQVREGERFRGSCLKHVGLFTRIHGVRFLADAASWAGAYNGIGGGWVVTSLLTNQLY